MFGPLPDSLCPSAELAPWREGSPGAMHHGRLAAAWRLLRGRGVRTGHYKDLRFSGHSKVANAADAWGLLPISQCRPARIQLAFILCSSFVNPTSARIDPGWTNESSWSAWCLIIARSAGVCGCRTNWPTRCLVARNWGYRLRAAPRGAAGSGNDIQRQARSFGSIRARRRA